MKTFFLILFALSTSLFALTPLNFLPTNRFLTTVSSFQFQMDPSGNVVLVWSVNINGTNVIQSAYKPFGSDWQPTQTLSTTGFSVTAFQLAMDTLGNAAVVWTVPAGVLIVVQVAYKPAGSAWQLPGNPNTTANTVAVSVNGLPQIAVGGGNIALAWSKAINFSTVAQAAYKKPTSPWTVTTQLSPTGFSLTASLPPALALDMFGNGVVAWQATNNTSGITVVQGVYKFVGSAAWSATALTTLSQVVTAISSPPQVDIQNGNAVAVWSGNGGAFLQAAYNQGGVGWQLPGF